MYKYSQFNSIVQVDSELALLNTFTNKVIFILPELRDMLNAALNEGINELLKFHPSFFNYLVQNEFLIEETIDEVNKVKELVKQIDENEDEFILTINPTMNCNFKCWYCYETHIKQSKVNIDIISRINLFIDKTMDSKQIKSFPLAFFGGEPLLYFEQAVVPITNYYIEKCYSNGIKPNISFTTNGFLINEEIVKYFDTKHIKPAFQITLDGSKEDHDTVRYVNSKTGSYDKITNNIVYLINNGFPVSVRVNYTDKNIHKVAEIKKEFEKINDDIKKQYLSISFHRVWQNEGGEDIDNILHKTMELFSNEEFNVNSKATLNTVLGSCYADKRNSATINYNGDIFKCTARDFKTKNRDGFINEKGELVWENDSLNKRMNSKFKNKPCLSCRLLPICNGGCSQAAIENSNTEYCVHNGDEREKDKAIIARIIEMKRLRNESKELSL